MRTDDRVKRHMVEGTLGGGRGFGIRGHARFCSSGSPLFAGHTIERRASSKQRPQPNLLAFSIQTEFISKSGEAQRGTPT